LFWDPYKTHMSWVHPVQNWDHFSTNFPSLSTQLFHLYVICCMLIALNFLPKRRSSSRTVPARHRPRNGALLVHLQGAKKMVVWGCWIGIVGRMREKKSTPLLQLPPLYCELLRGERTVTPYMWTPCTYMHYTDQDSKGNESCIQQYQIIRLSPSFDFLIYVYPLYNSYP
jgi:hypothetical protein